MKYKLLRKILTVVSMFLAGILAVSTIIVGDNITQINNFLGTSSYKLVETGDPNQDTQYYKSDFSGVKELLEAGKATATQVMEEGAVLLKNDNAALPLAKGSKVSLVGVTGYDPVYGGTGSGTISVADAVNYVDSLESAGLVLNPTLKEKYTSEDWAQYKRGSTGSYGTTVTVINEAPWDVVEGAAGSTFAEYGDAAIFVVGRIGGEGTDNDRKTGDGIDNNDGLLNDYLGLTANELSVLHGLKAKKQAGEISKIIVLVNYSSMIEGDFLNDPDIDAAMWVGALGVSGAAVGRLLTGDVSPSGRLPDTMWVDNAMNPVNANFGRWTYEGADELGVPTALGTGQYPASTLASYVVYQEGMYLGYRYTETRYEDLVLGTANVGDYDYNAVVARPFGFGLSYADFALSNVTVTREGERNYIVSVTVTNTSSSASGKHSVPVYVSKPYGDYARTNGIQVPSVELVGMGKTKILAPGESETLTITLDEKYFASYDAYGAKGYVLMDGDYYIAVGGDAHEAVNNLLAAKKANGIAVDESKMVGGTGDASLTAKFTMSFDKDKYAFSDAVSALDGTSHLQVTNLFDFADINLYEGRGDNHVDYYSRDNWAGTVSLDMENGHVKLTMTEQMAYDIYAQLPAQTGNYNNAVGVPDKYKQPIERDDGEYPLYGQKNGLQLIDMRYDEEGNEITYQDPVWDTFMDQLTWDETVNIVSSGFHQTMGAESVAKPATKDENGPNGFGGWAFRNGYLTGQGLAYRKEQAAGHVNDDGSFTEDVDQDALRKPTGFPANGILAATFNQDLAYQVGHIIGEDGLWAGFSGLYGVGLNIHRSPYSGRTCEYFSECGMLTGLIAAQECKAIEEKGVHVYNKHCALNDQENNRHGICTWVNEQAIREIYLRAFELPIVEGGAFNTMASFSRFGTQAAAACPALATYYLRGECGMKGIIVTDAYGDMDGSQNCDPYFEMVYGVLVGGSDIPDGAQPANDSHFAQFRTGYSKMGWAMRESAKRVCYQTLWSNAMNGISSTTRVVQTTPSWLMTIYVADAVVGVVFAASLLWTLIALLQEGKKKAKG